ncbi:MAG: bifunctional UDP-N-acetylmuramoyl-tripeptide:D-alanyl-D-alanine ligase/alanine racemase [Cytophagales bacterium]|nr:bifunctional UDP-N-acetylmuramoyl-tripeptide:D-alanyl-D-alanine ligase/alanine racemase [Cytophagales bacterium]
MNIEVTNNPILDTHPLLLTDSRFLSQPSKTLFIAIKGERHDGHLFIKELMEKGVKSFIVSEEWAKDNGVLLTKARFWVTANPVKTLQEIAVNHRNQFDIPVIGITGSNGKTIVKEWLSSILQKSKTIVKSPRSYNSQIGVPLSVWQMDSTHEVGIFEAGISQPAEMQSLQEIINPEIGIFTNIGSAHSEGFRSQKQKVTEKLRLFRKAKTLIYSQDYPELDEEIRIFLKAVNPKIELLSWSKNGKGTTTVDISKKDKFSKLNIYWNGEEFNLKVPFVDDASIENAIHCFFASYILLSKEYGSEEALKMIQTGLDSLKPIAMRLELKEAINNCYLIDDSYNNDFGGLQMALNFMNQHHINRKKTIILSDVLQSGQPKKELYGKISELLEGAEIEKVIGIGPDFINHKDLFNNIGAYSSVEEFLSRHPIQSFQNELILVKGARDFTFEKIVNELTHKVHGTVLEVNLDAVTHNLNYYRSLLPEKTKLMVMVKASAYGSGSTEVASLLQYHRVDYLAVAYTDEGVQLRENGIDLPIMVLNPQPESFKKLIDYKLEPEIYSLGLLQSLIKFIHFNDEPTKPLKIHLKLDTGMKRLGFIKDDVEELLNILHQESCLEVASIFSHLAASDSKKHKDFTLEQINNFEHLSGTLIRQLKDKPLRHIANTAAISNYPQASYDMVRLGIGLYGIDFTDSHQEELQNVASLKTTISQIKKVKKGETVGYSRMGLAKEDMRIATIAIGYADGFDRKLSNGKGQVWINGQLCPIIGNVCMDMSMVDISKVNAEEGDSVEVFGKQINIFDVAKTLETIPYEILTKIGTRVKRVFFKE